MQISRETLANALRRLDPSGDTIVLTDHRHGDGPPCVALDFTNLTDASRLLFDAGHLAGSSGVTAELRAGLVGELVDDRVRVVLPNLSVVNADDAPDESDEEGSTEEIETSTPESVAS